MIELDWSETEAEAFLRGMLTVASLDGSAEPEAIDLEVLESTRKHILHREIDLSTLRPITGAELAKAIPEHERRLHALEFAILMPYVPGELSPERVKIVDSLADGMGVHPVDLETLHQVRDGHLNRLIFDHARKTMHDYVDGDTTSERIRGVVKLLRQHIGDDDLAERYARLQDLPEGSLGLTLYHFYRDRGFPLPGEGGGFVEFLVPHDISHILSGLNTHLEGEIGLAAFESGMCRTDFAYQILLAVMLEFHLGIRMYTPAFHGHLDPEQMAIGFELGAQMNRDILKDWNWWEVVDQPVEALRAHFGLPEIDGIVMKAPKGQGPKKEG